MANLLPAYLPRHHARRLLYALAAFAAIHATGTVGYVLLGPVNTSPFDALYMTFITVATIGYTEVVDLHGNTPGRLFTMAIALAGIGATTYMFSTVTALILETNLSRAFWSKRMQAEINRLEGHYIVCGGGRVGGYVMDELRSDRRSFVVIEHSRAQLDRHLELLPRLLIIEGDAADDDVLLRAGIARAAGVFAVTGDDSKNLVISLSAKQLNPAVQVIARVHDQRNAAKTLRAGADNIVSPDFTGGHRIASLMIRPQMVSLMDELVRSGSHLAVEEVTVPSRPFPLRVGALGRSDDWLLIAIRDGSNWQFNPPQDALIAQGNALVVIASARGREALETLVAA